MHSARIEIEDEEDDITSIHFKSNINKKYISDKVKL